MSEKNPAAVALGSVKSKAKAAASRRNGKLGGRPRNPKQNNRHAYGLGNGKVGKKADRKERHDRRIAELQNGARQ